MENGNNRRTEGNDILREAFEAESEKKFFDYENDTVVFKKAYKQNSHPAKDDKSELQHTAQIRGGAVVRPLKQQTSKSTPPKSNSPAVNKTAPANPQQNRKITPDASRTHAVAAVSSKPKNPAVPKPIQPPVQAQPNKTPVKPLPKTQPAIKPPQSAVNKPAAPERGQRTPVSPVREPAVKRPPKTDYSKVNIKTNVNRRETDFEIDEEATYTSTFGRRRFESGLDSAASAIMSLVKAMVYIVIIVAVSVGLSVFVINTANDVFKFVVPDKIVTVHIPEYATIDDVTDALYDAGAIKYKWAFKLWSNIKLKDYLKENEIVFIPGDYEISTTLNYDYLRMAFQKSSMKKEVRITIPEGFTVDDIIDRFVENGIGTREGFIDVINNYDFDYPFLDGLITREGRIYRLEGYLFPDTYDFYQDSDEVTVIKKLLDNFNRKFVDEYYSRCTQLGISVDDAIILASMVEKETRYADELGDVSSVFHNRLKYSSTFPYLNCDATIMYAMGHDLGGRPDTMTGEDTEYDSPYNTYKYKGLPPGPIANPGLNSIKYALYPNETNYFYFVSDNVGRMLFATTEPEHLANVNSVRRK